MSNENNHGEPLIRVSHLKQYFPINVGFFWTKPLKAVDDISFDIMEERPWVWSGSPAAVRLQRDVRSCTCTNRPRAK